VSDGLAGVGNVRGLIYLCAFQLDVGESLPAADPGRAPPWWDVHEQEGYVDVRDPQHVFYNDCPPDVAARASARLTHQSLASWRQPLRAAAWRGIPSTYVVCTKDAAIPLSLQEHMASRAGQRLSLEASHSPFLSQPGSVANLLRGVLEQVSRA
jgi:pimeloyl-ACP methyl ester carboxylesterase